jgi:hypothetical protein
LNEIQQGFDDGEGEVVCMQAAAFSSGHVRPSSGSSDLLQMFSTLEAEAWRHPVIPTMQSKECLPACSLGAREGSFARHWWTGQG